MEWLHNFADIASIIAAAAAVFGYSSYRLILRRRTRALEKVLAKKNQPNDDSLTLKQLAIALAMTETQVIEAASRSKKIETWAGQSGTEYRFRTIKNPN